MSEPAPPSDPADDRGEAEPAPPSDPAGDRGEARPTEPAPPSVPAQDLPRAAAPRRRGLRAQLARFELALVVLASLAVLVPGIWSYSLVDPWETHYGEVAREMLQDDDLVHTKWTGCYMCEPNENEGFRSKPVLMFWMMAAGLTAAGVAEDGGYSGELTATAWTMVGIRMPFILSAVAGLALMWWMLARLVGRRMAWIGLIVVGSTPMFCMIARNAIPDMPMVACTIGALSLWALAMEDGERPVTVLTRFWKDRIAIDARHVVIGIAAGFVLLQAAYYAFYFVRAPVVGVRGRVAPDPAILLPGLMVLALIATSRDGWKIVRLPFVLVGGVIAAIVDEPMPRRSPGQSLWRHFFDDILGPWDRHALDRYALRAVIFVGIHVLALEMLEQGWRGRLMRLVRDLVSRRARKKRSAPPPQQDQEAPPRPPWRTRMRRAAARSWRATSPIADRLLAMSPIVTMRQVYLLGMYFLLGVSVLAKGPPGLTVVAAVAALHVICLWRWRALADGAFELKRGLLLMAVVAVPWHAAMYFRAGPAFVNEYVFTHILNRAGAGVDNSPGTFEYYTSQIGHGMWLWAALLPAALGAAVLRARKDTREGRVRFLVTLWAIVAVAVFCIVQTKFHHYILPALPPLALLVAFFLDDLYARRDRLHPIFAALGAGIALLVCRDLMYEPDRWIEMFVFRYDRPWPTLEPYAIDPSDGVLALGLAAAVAIAIAATRFVRIGVALVCAVGLAICLWALQVYMPHAGTHWGMREAVRTYYEQRTIYGQQLAYFGMAQLHDDWSTVGETWSFETFIPDDLQVGQPMTIRIQVWKPTDERALEKEVQLAGAVTAIGEHEVTIALHSGERAKLDPLLAEGKRQIEAKRGPRGEAIRGRRPVRYVDADRLLAWHLYWRGELFWSGGEIWAWPQDMKTYFGNPNNVQFQKYLNDRQRAPLGRRYFVITEGTRLPSTKSILPTQRGRDSFEILNQTSNKFAIGAFYM